MRVTYCWLGLDPAAAQWIERVGDRWKDALATHPHPPALGSSAGMRPTPQEGEKPGSTES